MIDTDITPMDQKRQVEIAQILGQPSGHDQGCPFRQAARDLWHEMHRLSHELENARLSHGVSSAEH